MATIIEFPVRPRRVRPSLPPPPTATEIDWHRDVALRQRIRLALLLMRVDMTLLRATPQHTRALHHLNQLITLLQESEGYHNAPV
jgi:hypothetical protein